MATESVDEILDTLVTEYMAFETPDVVEKAKVALDAYYTRECARKVLEELEALKLNTGWTADDYRAVLNERIAHFRAAIEEVGGGDA